MRKPKFAIPMHTEPTSPVYVVTGANGFLGAHLVCSLLKKKVPVIAIIREQARLDEFILIQRYYGILDQPQWERGELWDIEFLCTLFSKATTVFHCAGKVSFRSADSDALLYVNRELTASVVNACLMFPKLKLVHVSSTSAIGRPQKGAWVSETTPWDHDGTNTAYGRSKYLGELEVWRGIEEGLHAVIVNPSVIDGPGDFTKGTCAVYHRLAKGTRLTTQGGSGYVAVGDVCEAMWLLSQSDIEGQRFLLVSSNLKFQDFFEMVCKQLGVNAPNVYVSETWSLRGAWLLEKLYGLFGASPFVTRELARSAHQITYYKADKIKQYVSEFVYTEIADSIIETAKFYSSLQMKDGRTI